MVRQRPAKPCTRVRFPSPPPHHNFTRSRAISSVGERFPDTEEVTGSIPVSRTTVRSVSPGSSARGFSVSSGLYCAPGALLYPRGFSVSPPPSLSTPPPLPGPTLVFAPPSRAPHPALAPTGPAPRTDTPGSVHPTLPRAPRKHRVRKPAAGSSPSPLRPSHQRNCENRDPSRMFLFALRADGPQDRSQTCGCSAAGSASPCQGEGRGFESRHPLGETRETRSLPRRPARLAQWESASLTRKRSQVQSLYRAPHQRKSPGRRPGLLRVRDRSVHLFEPTPPGPARLGTRHPRTPREPRRRIISTTTKSEQVSVLPPLPPT